MTSCGSRAISAVTELLVILYVIDVKVGLSPPYFRLAYLILGAKLLHSNVVLISHRDNSDGNCDVIEHAWKFCGNAKRFLDVRLQPLSD